MLVEDLGHTVIGCAAAAPEALALAEATPPDLVLMDINIEGAYDGVETAEQLHKLHFCPVIFITAREDEQTFQRASRLGPVNFLLKPFNDLQVSRAIQLAINVLADPPSAGADDLEEENLYVKTDHKLRKIPVADISFVAADGRYCEIHTTTNRYLIRMPLKELRERLPVDRFLQTHRGCLVNEDFVESVDLRDSEIILKGGQRVPLAKREREAFLQRIEKL
ncbi:MAG: response regulator transcription factor [Bacteroidota bacterium]